jgi:dUTPase
MVKKSEIKDETASEFIDLQPMPMAPTRPSSAPLVQVYRENGDVAYPTYNTDKAGTFSLVADLSKHQQSIPNCEAGFNRTGLKKIREDVTGRHILIEPGERVLIGTGLQFVLPEGCSMIVSNLPKLGFFKGLVLTSGIMHFDEDIRGEIALPFVNNSRAQCRIDDQEPLAFAEIRPSFQAYFEATDTRPSVA